MADLGELGLDTRATWASVASTPATWASVADLGEQGLDTRDLGERGQVRQVPYCAAL